MPIEAKHMDAITGKPSPEKGSPVTNVVKLDPENPIPIDYGQNLFTTISGKKYIPFLGDKDNLPNTLWEARLLSSTHNACVSSIAKTCVGKGLYVTNVDENAVDKEFLSFIANINADQSLNDLVQTGIDAIETDGNAFCEVVKGDVAGKKFIRAYVHTSLVCRLADPGEEDRVREVIRSLKFAEKRNRIVNARSLKAVTIPLHSDNSLDSSWLKNDKGGEHSMMHLKNSFPGMLHYGLPRGIAGLRYQVLEGKSAQFNIDEFDNGMVMSGLIVFKSAMTQAEAQKNAKEIIKAHTGAGKIGRVGVVSSEGGIEDFEFVPLETRREGSFIEFDKRIEQKIIAADNWDAIFFGMGNESALGKGSGYVRAVYDVKKATVIDPICEYWLSRFINPLIKIAADHLGKVEWKNYQLAFSTAMPFSYASDININKVLTKNEGRELVGKQAQKGSDWDQPIDSGNKQTSSNNVPPEPTT